MHRFGFEVTETGGKTRRRQMAEPGATWQEAYDKIKAQLNSDPHIIKWKFLGRVRQP